MSNAPANGGPLKTLLPVFILLALVGVAVVYFVFFNKSDTPPTQTPPTVERPPQKPIEMKPPSLDLFSGAEKVVADEVKAVVEGLTSTLSGITDAATAETALPKITDLNTKLDGVKPKYDKMAGVFKLGIAEFLKGKLGSLKELAGKAMAPAGMAEKLKSVQGLIDGLEQMTK